MSQPLDISYFGRTLRVRVQAEEVPTTHALHQTFKRFIRFPAATFASIVAVVAVGFILSLLPNAIPLHPVSSLLSFLVGGLIFHACSALMILKGQRLEHLSYLTTTALVQSLKFAVIMGLPLVGLSYFLPDWTSIYFDALGFDTLSPYFLVGLGALFSATTDSDWLIAWPLACDTGYPVLRGKIFVWEHIEGETASPYAISVAGTALSVPLLMFPLTAILVPIFLAHLTAAYYDRLITIQELEQ